MLHKMDPYNPEVKKENDTEDEASPSIIIPNTSLCPQFGIKEDSEGSENDQFMVEVKEEIDVKVEEEDLPPPEDPLMLSEDPLMLCDQEGPSSEESRGEKRTITENDTQKIIVSTNKTDGESHPAKRFKNLKEAREDTSNSSDLIHSTSNVKDVHATKFDFICDGVTARSQQNPESPECSSKPTRRQNAIIIAKEDHAVNKLQVVKVIKGDPSKAQNGKDHVIIKVSVAPKSEGSKIITATPHKVILAYANSAGSSKDHSKHTITLGQVPSPGSDVDTDASPKANQQKNVADPMIQDNYKKCAPVNKISPKKDAAMASRHIVQSRQKQKEHCNTRYAANQHYAEMMAFKMKELEMKEKILEHQLLIIEKEKERYKLMAELTRKSAETLSTVASTIKLVDEVKKRKKT